MDNYYKILEVSSNASEEVIKVAHRVLTRKHHPDTVDGSDVYMKKLNIARDTLLDPIKRFDYDRALRAYLNNKKKSGSSQPGAKGASSSYRTNTSYTYGSDAHKESKAYTDAKEKERNKEYSSDKKSTSSQGTGSYSPPPRNSSSNQSKPNGISKRRTLLGFVIFAAIVIYIAFTLQETPGTISNSTTSYSDESSNSLATSKSNAEDTNDGYINTNSLVGLNVFTLGSRKSDVKIVMGQPTNILENSNVWYYGEDRIGFDGQNRVISYKNYSGRLKVQLIFPEGELDESLVDRYNVFLDYGTPLEVKYYGATWIFTTKEILFTVDWKRK